MALQRREFLGLMGAGAASTFVLTACGKLGAGKVKGPTIGMLQMVDAPPPNAVRQGFEAALAEAGYIPGKSVNFIQKDAAGELPNTTLVMKKFVSDQVEMVFAIGTPPLQAAMKTVPETTPVVFAYCSNPWGAGAGTPPGGVGQHKPNVVGTIGTNPMGKELDLARTINPELKTVGVIFNPGEPNSEYEAKVLRDEAKQRGITVIEQSVANSGEVLQAAQVLSAKGIDAFVKIGDYATIQGFGSIAKVGLEKKIPVYSVDGDDIKLPGCLATIGWAYFDDGYAAGKIAVRVLKGEQPKTMAFEPLTKTETNVNLVTAEAIGVSVPESVIQQSKLVVRA
jgi:putative ABC transport system substrate-binding protein